MTTPPPGRADTAEVLIVGAGPAGSVTALLLARQGLDVRLLDRAAFPRAKACGDCLSAAATELLGRLGLLHAVRAAGASTIERWRIFAPDGTAATGSLRDTPALSLERRLLDAVLRRGALAAGARPLRTHVTDLVFGDDGRVAGVRHRQGAATEEVIRARLVIGADGLRSIVARRLDRVRRPPRLRKVSLTAHLPAPADQLRQGEMHLIPHGCVGWAPAGADVCNLTLVVSTDDAAGLGEAGPAAFFRDRIRRAPRLELPPRSADALRSLGDDDILASGPFDFPGRRPIARGAALVGDAAGYYDPFTGQGVYQAMASAERLAAAVGPALLDGEGRGDRAALDGALRRYARTKRRLTRRARRVQHGVEWVLSRPRLADRVLGRLAEAPVAMDRLVQVTGDLKPPMALLSPAVVSSFILPPSRR